MKDKLVSHDDIRKLHPVFAGKHGDKLMDLGIKLSGLKYANQVYNASKHLTGPAFCKDVLNKIGVTLKIKNVETLEAFKNKSFITVSNHPYGHVDGISIIAAIASLRPDYKVVVNAVLGLIDTMSENFIQVNPNNGITGKKGMTLNGIKTCINHLNEGNALGLFPSGAISNLYLQRGKWIIEDREWQPSIIKLIQKAKKPVIPIHISGRNSLSFYSSRILGWQARNLRLCHELINKSGKEIVLTVGEPIYPDEIKKYPNPSDLGKYLKSKTYALAK